MSNTHEVDSETLVVQAYGLYNFAAVPTTALPSEVSSADFTDRALDNARDFWTSLPDGRRHQQIRP
jgi:hypothetical protein